MSSELKRLRRADGVEDFKHFWGLEVGPVLLGGGGGWGFSRATIVKPDLGELARTNPGGIINPVLTLAFQPYSRQHRTASVQAALLTWRQKGLLHMNLGCRG